MFSSVVFVCSYTGKGEPIHAQEAPGKIGDDWGVYNYETARTSLFERTFVSVIPGYSSYIYYFGGP